MKTKPIRQLFASIPLLLLASCAQTDVIDSGLDSGFSLTITLSAPQASTRADNSHMLRYTARLFKGSTPDAGKIVDKKQLIEDGSTSTLTFEGVEEGDYCVLVFADYIPADATPSADGIYPDNYYDTSKAEDVALKNVSSDLINNENLDCFAACEKIVKEKEEKRVPVTLKRAVAKVRVVSASEKQDEVENILISKFSILKEYKVTTKSASAYNAFPNCTLSKPWEVTPSDLDSNELFFYYTFATDPQEARNGTNLVGLAFTVNSATLDPVSFDIPTENLIVKSNWITTLRGDFLPALPEDPSTRSDKIILDLTPDPSWATLAN